MSVKPEEAQAANKGIIDARRGWVRTRLRCQANRRRQRAGILKSQVSHMPGRTVGMPLVRTVSTPLLPSPSVPVRGFARSHNPALAGA
jgi:hypothetical protein